MSSEYLESLKSLTNSYTKIIDEVYKERNLLVSLLSKLYPSWIETHAEIDINYDPNFKYIVYITLPTGQVSWHLKNEELQNFKHLAVKDSNSWDGHSDEEKYRRIGTGTFSSFYSKHNFDYTRKLTVADVQAVGFSPELFGRFQQKIYLQRPSIDVIKEYFTSEYSPLKHLQNELALDGNQLNIPEYTISKLTALAYESETGIRGIDEIIQAQARDILYESLLTRGKTFDFII